MDGPAVGPAVGPVAGPVAGSAEGVWLGGFTRPLWSAAVEGRAVPCPYRSPSDSRAIFSWSFRIPWSSASGRGGQPGTYTSTGMIWSTPLVTEYESQYGPPQLEHAPKEMTYFGSGICS